MSVEPLLFEVFQRDGFGEVITLIKFATHGKELLELLCGLNTFSEGIHTEFFGHVDDVLDDHAGLNVTLGVFKELHVDLDNIDIHILEEIE